MVKAYTRFKDRTSRIPFRRLPGFKKGTLGGRAITTDKTTWLHVSDLKGWENEVAMEYGITAIPQNFLIDPNGVIIAKNLRGDALSEKLGEIFAAKN